MRAGLACAGPSTSSAPTSRRAKLENNDSGPPPSSRPAGAGRGGAPQSVPPAPTSRLPRPGEARNNFAQRCGAPDAARPRLPVRLPAQRGPARSSREAAHVRPPRPDKGVPADPEGRALAARGLGPSPRARVRSGHWRRRRTERTRCPLPRPVGSVRPATSAGATAASSSCGGRHVPSPARALATPTPGPAYGPPRPGTP